LLEATRREGFPGRRRRGAINSALRKSVPIRTFADWKDVKPGFFQIDFVEHCGGVTEGTFVHSLVLTDVASGWTECVALPAREQTLVIEGFTQVSTVVPFPIRGFNSDNDSAFINDTVVDYCRERALQFTRSRAYRKNDQAWIEQKNGAVVRRLVGYGRLQGRAATMALAWTLCSGPAVCELFSAVVQARIEDARGFPRDQALLGSDDTLRAASRFRLPQRSDCSAIAPAIVEPRSVGTAAQDPHGAGGAGWLHRHRLGADPSTGRWKGYRYLRARTGHGLKNGDATYAST
jgi:hypothetical protein